MKTILTKIFLIILTAALLFSCANKSDSVSLDSTEAKSSNDNTVNTEQVEAQNLAERTILYYLIGSDLEENIMSGTETISELSKIKNDENLNIIIMTGGSLNENIEYTRKEEENIEKFKEFYNIDWETNQIWQIRDGFKPVVENFGKEDMTDGKTLLKFVNYVKSNFPAKKYDIIFNDHGGAALNSFGSDSRYSEEGGSITLKELDEVFKAANIKFEIVGFDACLMASFELMYVLEPYCDYLVAAEETAFGSWDYSFLDAVAENPNIDPIVYGKSIVDKFMEKAMRDANSLGVYSLNGFKEKVENSLTVFCKNMNKYLSEDYFLIDLYGILKNTIGLGYINIDDIRDLRDFLDWIENLENSEMPLELKNSAHDLWKNVEQFIVYYRSLKQKNEDGTERTGGVNFVYPVKNVYYDDGDEYDSAILSMENYPESLNEDYREMFKLGFLRKSLVKALKTVAYSSNDNDVMEYLDAICDRAYEKYNIKKEYIDSIKNNITPVLAGNRIKANADGNISFEKVENNNKISFNLIFDQDIKWMISEPMATAMTYDAYGKEQSLGSTVVMPKTVTTNGNFVYWNIEPDEDRWFTVVSDNTEYVVEFVISEQNENSDKKSLDYLFQDKLEGFIPAIVKRYENDEDEENIVQIHVEFDKGSDVGKILGFTRFDQNSNMSAKQMEELRAGDKITLISDFEKFDTSKTINYLYGSDLLAEDFKVYRGFIETQSVYFKYSAVDIYGETYEFEVENRFAFEIGDEDDYCFYATVPSTWTDVTANIKDGSFESKSMLGEHVENMKINMYDITNDVTHFGDVMIGEEFPESVQEYLLTDTIFSKVENYFSDTLTTQYKISMPMFTAVGIDKNQNKLNKKYIYFEREDKKYMIELSSSIDGKHGEKFTYHDFRLVKTALELLDGAEPNDGFTITQKISVE